MKKLFSLFLCALLLVGCAGTYNGPTMEKTVLCTAEEDFYGMDGVVTQRSRTEYAYDIYGNQTVVQEYNDDAPYLKTILRYDDAGNTIRQTQYDVSGWLPKRLSDGRYTYDSQGRMIRSTHHQEADTVITYDDTARTRTTTCGETVIVEYLDKNGWVLRTESSFPGRQSIREEYDRSPNGEMLGIRSYENGVLISETVMTYDDQGRILTQTQIKNGVSALLFAWEYGENYEKRTDYNGYQFFIRYLPDGSMDTQEMYDENGRLHSRTTYHYTTIQVPVGKEDTP